MFKKNSSWTSSCLSASIFTCVLCTQIRTQICQDMVHLDFEPEGRPGVLSRTLGNWAEWAHIKYPTLSVPVCVCVRIHTHTHTYLPTRVKKRQDARQHSYLSRRRSLLQVLSKITSQAKGQVLCINCRGHHCDPS